MKIGITLAAAIGAFSLNNSSVLGFSSSSLTHMAFHPMAATGRKSASFRFSSSRDNKDSMMSNSYDPLGFAIKEEEEEVKVSIARKTSAAMVIALLSSSTMMPSSANAAGPDWGLFEGRTGSLLHPVIMGSMLLLSLGTALLGFQYRRQRNLGSEISELKKTLPSMNGASTLADAIANAEAAETVDTMLVQSLKAAIPVEMEIQALTQERKDLSSMGLRDKHFNQGALLAFLGTAFAIEGPLNTYARAGKLFPGPHLYAGAGLVVLWSAAAACVPAMQKGNDTARSLHIGANVAGIGLFAWQVVSGWPILLKVIEKTSWP